MGLFAEAMATAGTAREKQAQTLVANINTSMIVTDMTTETQSEGAGVGYGLEGFQGVPCPERGRGKIRIFHVFNPSVHKRHELVEFTLWDWPWDLRRVQVTSHNGKDINFQLLDTELRKYWDHRFVRFLVEVEVPSMGYSTVVFKEKEMGKAYPFYFHPFPRSEPIHGRVILENEFLCAEFDPETGGLFSLLDKEANKELIAANETGSLLLTWSEKETNNAWRIGRRLGHEKVTHTTNLKLFTGNALRNSLEFEQEILNSKVKMVISLDKGAKALSYRFNIAWNETAAIYDKIPVLCYVLPLKDHVDSYLADVPGGVARRTEAFQDHPGLQYTAAVKGGDAIALVTDCKYGYRGYKDVLSVTLINTAQRPDLTPERGEHFISLWVTLGKNKPKELTEVAGDFCHPMAVVSGTSHPGTLMPEMELLGFKADSSVFCSATLDKSGSLLIRVNELEGKKDTISLRFPRIIKSAELVDLDGKSLGILNSRGNELCFEVEPFRVQGARIQF
jgi:alpha-mannosidase